jgi:hypothetical protein
MRDYLHENNTRKVSSGKTLHEYWSENNVYHVPPVKTLREYWNEKNIYYDPPVKSMRDCLYGYAYQQPYSAPSYNANEPNWRNYQNSSWRDGPTMNVNYPQGSPIYVSPPKKTLEDTLQMESTSQIINEMETLIEHMESHLTETEEETSLVQPPSNLIEQLEVIDFSSSDILVERDGDTITFRYNEEILMKVDEHEC